VKFKGKLINSIIFRFRDVYLSGK